jgi:hypothetical protein
MMIVAEDHCVARSKTSSTQLRLGYRVSEWSEMTGTSRVTTWRNIKNGALRAIDYNGITLIPRSEAVRLKLLNA